MRWTSLLGFISCWLATSAQAGLPRVLIVGTGGTIAGRAPKATGASYKPAQLTVDDLVSSVPELQKLAALRSEQVLQVASQAMTPDDWLTLARAVQRAVASPEVDGVVVTHGTDTLEETAYFLDLMLPPGKPVVLTGAMRPSNALSADGPGNLHAAVQVAACEEARGVGVLVVLGGQIHAARDVGKGDTVSPTAFDARGTGPLGRVAGDRVLMLRKPTRSHTAQVGSSLAAITHLPRVEVAYGYAGASRQAIDAFVASAVDGIVYAGVGNGNMPPPVEAALLAARRQGIAVVRSSRVGAGPVLRNAEVNDDALGFVVADDLTPQKARVLLMLGLTKTRDAAALQALFFSH